MCIRDVYTGCVYGLREWMNQSIPKVFPQLPQRTLYAFLGTLLETSLHLRHLKALLSLLAGQYSCSVNLGFVAKGISRSLQNHWYEGSGHPSASIRNSTFFLLPTCEEWDMMIRRMGYDDTEYGI